MSGNDVDTVKKMVLDLLSPSQLVADEILIQLNTTDQDALIKSVRDHRLGPMLRYMLKQYHPNVVVPERLKAVLNTAYKKTSFRALRVQQCLINTHRILGQHHIPYMALKGIYLAFHAYPQAALRPMRDLDILVPEGQALEAFYLLLSKGFNRMPNCLGSPEFALKMKHQLPPLIDPVTQMVVELHNRLGDPNHLTISVDEGLWSRSIQKLIGNELISFESPVDLLLHLIQHAAYHHRFDNGPLLLTDITFLLNKHDVDWVMFWQLARQDSMASGAILVLRLVNVYWPDVSIEWPDFSVDSPLPQILDDAAYSLLRDYDCRRAVTLKINSGVKGFFGWLVLGCKEVFTSKERLAGRYSVQPDSLKIYAYYLVNFGRLLTNWLPRILNLRLSDQDKEILRLQRLDHFLKVNRNSLG